MTDSNVKRNNNKKTEAFLNREKTKKRAGHSKLSGGFCLYKIYIYIEKSCKEIIVEVHTTTHHPPPIYNLYILILLQNSVLTLLHMKYIICLYAYYINIDYSEILL